MFASPFDLQWFSFQQYELSVYTSLVEDRPGNKREREKRSLGLSQADDEVVRGIISPIRLPPYMYACKYSNIIGHIRLPNYIKTHVRTLVHTYIFSDIHRT